MGGRGAPPDAAEGQPDARHRCRLRGNRSARGRALSGCGVFQVGNGASLILGLQSKKLGKIVDAYTVNLIEQLFAGTQWRSCARRGQPHCRNRELRARLRTAQNESKHISTRMGCSRGPVVVAEPSTCSRRLAETMEPVARWRLPPVPTRTTTTNPLTGLSIESTA